MRHALLMLLLLALPPAAMAQGPLPPMEEKRKVLFDRLYENVRRDLPDFSSPDLQSYVNAVGARLWPAEAEADKLNVTVVDSPDAVSNIIPGRLIFLSATLFTRLQGEAELAALLAHHIGHLAETPVKRPANLSSLSLIWMGDVYGSCSRFVAEHSLVPFGGLPAQREQEADLRALKILKRAGYDPSALVDARRRTPAATRLLPGEIKLVVVADDLDNTVVTNSTFDRLRAEVADTLRQRQPQRRPRFR